MTTTPRATALGEAIARRLKTNLLVANERDNGEIVIVVEAGAKIVLQPPYDMPGDLPEDPTAEKSDTSAKPIKVRKTTPAKPSGARRDK